MNVFGITIERISRDLSHAELSADQINQFNVQRIVSVDKIYWEIELSEIELDYGMAMNVCSCDDAKEISLAKTQEELDIILNKYSDFWDDEWDLYAISTNSVELYEFMNMDSVISTGYEDTLSDFQKEHAYE